MLPYSSSLLNMDSTLVRKEIVDPQIPSRIYVVWNRDAKLSAEAERFLDLISVKSDEKNVSL